MLKQGKHKENNTRRNGLAAATEPACLFNTKKAVCSSLTLAAREVTLTCPELLSSWRLRRRTLQIVMCGISCKSVVERTRITFR